MKTTRRSWFKSLFSSPKLTLAQLQATAAREGPEAQNNLGIFLMATERFELELEAATDSFRQAAEQGCTVAQYNLALSYQQGRGVPKDANQADKWFLKAAEAGDASAQSHLGMRLHRESLSADKPGALELQIEALKWLTLAEGQQPHNAERSRESLMLGMTAVQTAETNRRVAAFKSTRVVC